MSFAAQTWRAGSSQDPNGNGGPKIAEVNSTVGAALPASTDANVVENVTKALNDEYTLANVAVSTAPPEYTWYWDELSGTWVYRCKSATAYQVEVGEPRKIHVELAVTVDV